MDELDRARVHYAKFLVKYNVAHEKMEEAGTAIFSLYENLLDKTSLLKWNKIVHKQIGTSPWTGLKGKSHDIIHKKMVKSFKDCVKFYLLQVFPKDAAKCQKY